MMTISYNNCKGSENERKKLILRLPYILIPRCTILVGRKDMKMGKENYYVL
ncbi:hypothetical protein GCM10025777_30130 [Membranihabitans marinus]